MAADYSQMVVYSETMVLYNQTAGYYSPYSNMLQLDSGIVPIKTMV